MKHFRILSLIPLLLTFAFCTRFLNAGTLGVFTYELTGESVTITQIHNSAQGELVVPSRIEDKPVTTIGGGACLFGSFVTSLKLPPSVIRIGNNAFSATQNLTSCHLAEGLQQIGDNAFKDSVSLKTLSIPSTVTHIGGSAFSSCTQLEKINIPPGITTLNSSLFYGCTSLRECEIPNQVTEIGDYAFAYSSLEQVTIPSKVKSLGMSVFQGCERLRRVKLPDGMTDIGDFAFANSGLEQVTIPSKVTSLGMAVFKDCERLRRVKLPDGITEIGDYAFASCRSLKRIELPKTVIGIGNYAFAYTSLANLQLHGVKTIGANAFTGCNKLAAVRIPKSIKNIGDSAFFGCAQLAGASFEGDAPQMGERVFGQNGGIDYTDFTIFVEEDSTGFSIPRWLGYHLSRPRGEIAIHGFQRPYLLKNVISTRNFGQVPVGDKSLCRVFKLTNVGNRPLTSIRARIKGDDASDFLIVLPARTSLAPGKSTTVEIVFSPEKRGKRRTTLELENSDSNEGSYKIRLAGIGIEFL